MMTTPLKLTTCYWHSLNRGALVCRLYHTGQQSDGQRCCGTGTPQSNQSPNKINPKPIVSVARDYSQYRQESKMCRCRSRVQSISKPLWRVPERSVSTTTVKSTLLRVPGRCASITTSTQPLWRVPGTLTSMATSKVSLCRVPARCLSTTTHKSAPTKTNEQKMKYTLNRKSSRYVITPEMASLMVDKIWNWDNIPDDRLIVDINPGLGYLTKEVLNRGAKKVVAVERKKAFRPALDQIAEDSDGRLKVLEGNYFSLNQFKTEVSDKFHTFEDVFEGLEPLPWKADKPKFSANIIGIIPNWQEKGHAFNLASSLLKGSKAFHYGRVQHSLLMSERTYRSMTQEPCGRLVHYGNISALFQVGYDVKLLHVEPSSSFKLNGNGSSSKSSKKPTKPENLFLVQMTPKLDVFDDGLTEEASYLFVFFLGQMLMRRTAILQEKLETWVPGHTDIIFDFKFNEKTRTGDLSGTDYMNLFKAIRHLDTFSDWMEMHVCNVSQEQVTGYKDFMDHHISDSSEMEEEDVFDGRGAAFQF